MFTRKQSQQRDEQAIFDYENPPIEAVELVKRELVSIFGDL